MFEITRRGRDFAPVRDLVNLMTNDPFFQITTAPFDEEGNLAVDISEDDKELIVRASMPGFGKDDVEVHVHNGVLSIKAEHVEESEDKDERFYRRERRVGSLSRRIALPGVVTADDAKADLTAGVLTVRVPRADAVKPKQVAIN